MSWTADSTPFSRHHLLAQFSRSLGHSRSCKHALNPTGVFDAFNPLKRRVWPPTPNRSSSSPQKKCSAAKDDELRVDPRAVRTGLSCSAVMDHHRATRKDVFVGSPAHGQHVGIICKQGKVSPRKLNYCATACEASCFDPELRDFVQIILLIDQHAAKRHIDGRISNGQKSIKTRWQFYRLPSWQED